MSQFMRDISVAGRADGVDAKTADMGAAETTEMRASDTADMTASEVAPKAADVSATETADMAATTTCKSTGRGHSNHHGCGDYENFSVHRSFHDPSPILLVSRLI
jgi:hypothetical protein